MEGKRFDQLTRVVATSGSRRRMLGAVLAGALGGLRIRTTAADDEGTAIADASGGDHNVATVVDPAPNGNDHDTCAKAGELRKEGKPCCNDLVKDDDDRCVRPQSLDPESGGGDGGGDGGRGDRGGGGEGENPAANCGPTPCPADQSTGSTEPGICCDTGFCSCGGECCEGPDCWIFTPAPTGAVCNGDCPREEHCTPPPGCNVCPNDPRPEECCPDPCEVDARTGELGPCPAGSGRFGATIRRR